MAEQTLEYESAAPAFVVNESQRILQINDAACELLGIGNARSILGQHCYQVIRGRKMDGAPHCEAQCTVVSSVADGEAPEPFPMQLPPGSHGHVNGDGPDASERLPVDVSCVVVRRSGDHGEALILHLLRDARDTQAALRFATRVVEHAGRFLTDVTADSPIHTLTNQERRVLALIARGLDTAAIAKSLSLSKATVRNHTQHILKKLGCHSRLEAVALARPLLLASSFDLPAE